MILFTEKTRAIWFIGYSDGDYLAHAEELDDGQWKLTWRTRKIVESNDIKKWYTVTSTKEKILASQVAACNLGKNIQGTVYELIRGDTSLDEYMDMFSQLPFVTSKIMKIS